MAWFHGQLENVSINLANITSIKWNKFFEHPSKIEYFTQVNFAGIAAMSNGDVYECYTVIRFFEERKNLAVVVGFPVEAILEYQTVAKQEPLTQRANDDIPF